MLVMLIIELSSAEFERCEMLEWFNAPGKNQSRSTQTHQFQIHINICVTTYCDERNDGNTLENFSMK